MSLVSVIIPTLGRSSLLKVINSMVPDSELIKEIIVVDDSKNGIGEMLVVNDFNFISKTIILRTSGLEGPGNSRNIGLQFASGKYISFTDDDDPWVEKKLEKQLFFMNQYNLKASLCMNNKENDSVPWKGLEDPLVFLYRDKGFFRHSRFLPFGSLVYIKNDYASLRFNLTLREREDLWFMHEMYALDANMRQLDLDGIVVNRQILRSIRRPTTDDDLNWSDKLLSLSSDLSRNFLVYVSLRNAIITLNFLKALRIILKFVKVR